MSKSDKSLSRWKIILHRLWRIYPCYVFTILLQLITVPRSPFSPLFEEKIIEKCTREWWKNMIFINNFFGENDVCLAHSWYIACDFQFFLISLFTVPLLTRNPKKGILLNTIVVVCGLLVTALWVFIKEVPPAFLFTMDNLEYLLYVRDAYMAPFCHVAPYFLGILMGHLLFTTKGKIKIPKVYQAIGWFAASILFTSMLFMPFLWNSGTEYTVAESVFYFTFSKPLYALAVGWMVFCCATGHGGIINSILSFKAWIPLSRITFILYLISFPIQLYFLANLKRPIDTQWMLMIWVYCGDVTICCILSFIITLLLESPMIAIEHLTFSHSAEKKTEEE